MREPSTEPRFDQLVESIEKARALWGAGRRADADRQLVLVASLVMAEASERRATDPVPELARLRQR